MTEPKEIKAEIRRLKKIKNDLRPGSAKRLELGRKIKDLKGLLAEANKPEPEKDIIITQILKVEAEKKITPRFADIGIDLRKYTIKQLKIHLEKLKAKVRA